MSVSPATTSHVANRGAWISVSLGAGYVSAFADRFPCSGLNREEGVTFEFDAKTGDLVDAEHEGHADGPGLLALSKDAQGLAVALDRLIGTMTDDDLDASLSSLEANAMYLDETHAEAVTALTYLRQVKLAA